MLNATNLTYAYPNTDRPALRGVSLALDVGDILLVAGGTGSGKSTLCFALSGFVPHFFNGDIEGDVTMDGRSMREAKLGEWVQEVGLVLQNPFNQLSGARMTVFGEVAFGLENLGVPRDEMGPRVRAVLEQLEIAHLAERSPFALSGGQMQRVAIASILVLQPRLLVLDEPTAQLDPVGTREVFDVLRALADQGTTVVLVTHQLAEAAELATRAIVLHEGSIVAEGDTRTVLADSRLPGWRVEPPVYVPLAAHLGLPAPLPVTFEQAEGAFQRSALRAVESLADQWPFAPPRSPAQLPPIPPVPPVPVTVESLRYTYPNGVEALRGVSLRLEPGRIAALIGSNGAGKSTLSRSLNGLLRPAAGTVLAGDWNTAEHPTSELARRVGYLFQNPDEQLFKSTVGAEVAFGPQNFGFTEEEVEEAVAFALALTGLTELADEHPYDLHPTQRRWVALASVLAMRSPVLILDEPTTGLDLAGKEQMAALLLALREAGYTLLLVSHDMQFVAEYAETVYVMAEGQVIAQGTPASVFANDAALHRADVTVAPVARLARALNLGTDIVAAGQFVTAALRQPYSPSATGETSQP